MTARSQGFRALHVDHVQFEEAQVDLSETPCLGTLRFGQVPRSWELPSARRIVPVRHPKIFPTSLLLASQASELRMHGFPRTVSSLVAGDIVRDPELLGPLVLALAWLDVITMRKTSPRLAQGASIVGSCRPRRSALGFSRDGIDVMLSHNGRLTAMLPEDHGMPKQGTQQC